MIESSGGCFSDVETLVAWWKPGDNFKSLKPSRTSKRSALQDSCLLRPNHTNKNHPSAPAISFLSHHRLAKIVIGRRHDLPLNSSADRRYSNGRPNPFEHREYIDSLVFALCNRIYSSSNPPSPLYAIPLGWRLSGSKKDPVVQYDGGCPSKHRLPDLYTAPCQGAYPI